MEKYFFNVENLEQLRCQYRKLLKKYHPDNAGGSEEITKAINSEYEKIFRMLKQGHDSETSDNKKSGNSPDRADMYDWENDRTLRQVLYKIMNFEGIEIEMVGQWIWVFNSYSYRVQLKGLGFRYAANKKAWYFHTDAFRKLSNRKLSMDDIRNYYGSMRFYRKDYEYRLEEQI